VELDALHEKCIHIIHRDIAHLAQESVQGKLQPKDASTVINYTRLFSDIKGLQEEEAENLTDEDLESLTDEDSKLDPA
jgi:hypothetical protein